MDILQLYNIFRQHPVISTDSRNIASGSIFFALKGENFDGNRYVAEALAKGAAYAIADDREQAGGQAEYLTDEQGHSRLIIVDNVLKSMQHLAHHHRRQLNIPVIAITGTNGKTTTKELITAILAKKYKVSSTSGNLNNHIGVPITLLAMAENTQIAVIEMGANHPGEIRELCAIADPSYGLITNIGKAHIEGFGSLEGVVNTKSELYDHLRRKNGKCFVNCDNKLLVERASGLELLTYGATPEARLYGLPEDNSLVLTVRALFPKGWLYLRSNLVGSYNCENILAAACVGMYFNVDPLMIQQAIEEYLPGNNRSQLMRKGNSTIIMDAYNANPASMKAALDNFMKINHPAKILILGDMLELGDESQAEHQKIADIIKKETTFAVYLAGAYFSMTNAGSRAKQFKSTELLIDYLKNMPPGGNKLILLKGSRGMRLEKVAEVL